MDKHCGRVGLVGVATPVRGAWTIQHLHIGGTTLNKARCEPQLLRQMRIGSPHPPLPPLDGSEGCIYVFWHFHIWPVVLGIRYADGTKIMGSPAWLRTSVMQYATMLAVMTAFVGGFAGQLVGEITGIGTFLGGVGFAAGLVESWWGAIRLKREYAQAEND